MILHFSQPKRAQEWRPKLRKLFAPVLATYRSQGLVTKIFFYNRRTEIVNGKAITHLNGRWRGHFCSYRDHGLWNRDLRLFNYPEAVITLKMGLDCSDEDMFQLFAHEFYHWRQSCKRKINAWGKTDYSERKATKWQHKMRKKYYPTDSNC